MDLTPEQIDAWARVAGAVVVPIACAAAAWAFFKYAE